MDSHFENDEHLRGPRFAGSSSALRDFVRMLQPTEMATAPTPAAWRSVLAAVAVSLTTIAYCVSFAALVFQGVLEAHLSYGIGAALLGTGICAFAVAWRSPIKVAIAGADTPPMAVLAAMMASFAAAAPQGDAATVLSAAAFAIFLATLLTGIGLLTLGVARAASWLRFIPYPVIIGFVAASGWYLVAGAIRLAAADAQWSLSGDIDHALASRVLGTMLIAGALFGGRWALKSPLVVPLVSLGAIIVFIAVTAGFQISTREAQAEGWLLAAATAPSGFFSGAWLGVHLDGIASALTLFPDMIALFIVTSLAILMNVSGYEVATHGDVDLDAEFSAAGVANLIAALAGGFPGNISLNRTILNQQSGAQERAGGLAMGAACIILAFLGAGALQFVPTVLLSGILLFVGLNVLWISLVQTIGRLTLLEYALALVMVGIIAVAGYVGGVAMGLLACCLLFIVSYSRVPFLAPVLTRREIKSHVERPALDSKTLIESAERISVFRLQEYFFFGTAKRLVDAFAGHFRTLGPRRRTWAIVDFHRVTGIDSSARFSFVKLRQMADATGVEPVFSRLPRDIEAMLRQDRVLRPEDSVFPMLDQALEYCEEKLLEEGRAPDRASPSLEEWLAQQLVSRDVAAALRPYLTERALAPKDVLCREGSPSDSFYILLSGRISIHVGANDGGIARLRSMVGPTMVGEMGFFSRARRSATVIADTDAVVYELTQSALNRMLTARPDAMSAVQRMVIRTLTERLTFANAQIARQEA